MKSEDRFIISIALTVLLITACGPRTVPSSPQPTPVIESSPAQVPSAIPTEAPNSLETVSSSPQPTTVIELSPTQVPSAIPTETSNSLSEVKIYRDANAGFALDYYASWFIEDDAAQNAAGSAVYTVSLFSWDRVSYTPSPKDLNTLPDGATKIDITVFNQGPGTLEEAVYQYKNQDSGTPVNFRKEEDWTLNNGEKAVYIESEGAFGVVATMITLVKGRTIYVSGYGNLTSFKAIALSLRVE